MKGTRVAIRYAKSLLDLTVEHGELEKARQDMQLVLDTIRASRDFEIMLESPIIKTDKKLSILHEIFGASIGKVTMSFIDIITRKKRESYLEAIAEAFLSQYKERKNILTAVITTASGLDEDLRKKVLGIVKDGTKSEVELIEKINKDLIGGFVLRVGDRQVDASIARRLKTLNRNFSENPYIKEY